MPEITEEIWFERWRDWFCMRLGTGISESFDLYYLENEELGVSTTFQFPKVPNFNSKRTVKRQEEFLKKFLSLCRSFGFDPENEKDYNIDARTNKDNWVPNHGRVWRPFAIECYLFLHRQKLNIEATPEEIENHNSALANPNQRARPPICVLEPIVFFLEKKKGNKAALEYLRIYFSKRGKFRDDFKHQFAIFEANADKLRSENKIRKDTDLRTETPELRAIRRLDIARGGPLSSWAAQWRQDLLRLLLSQEKAHVIKSFKGVENELAKTLRDLLDEGSRELEKIGG